MLGGECAPLTTGRSCFQGMEDSGGDATHDAAIVQNDEAQSLTGRKPKKPLKRVQNKGAAAGEEPWATIMLMLDEINAKLGSLETEATRGWIMMESAVGKSKDSSVSSDAGGGGDVPVGSGLPMRSRRKLKPVLEEKAGADTKMVEMKTMDSMDKDKLDESGKAMHLDNGSDTYPTTGVAEAEKAAGEELKAEPAKRMNSEVAAVVGHTSIKAHASMAARQKARTATTFTEEEGRVSVTAAWELDAIKRDASATSVKRAPSEASRVIKRGDHAMLTSAFLEEAEDDEAKHARAVIDAKKQEDLNNAMNLKNLIRQAHSVEEEDERLRRQSWKERIDEMNKNEYESFVDLTMATVIAVNMLVIGISLDHPEDLGVQVVDGLISGMFILEILIKLKLNGKNHFCNPTSTKMSAMNVFDAIIVCADIAQLVVTVIFKDAASEVSGAGGSSSSILRILRLLRLTRIIKVLRLRIFQDLLLMMSGMASGMPRLFCAFGVFSMVVYIVALLARMSMGSSSDEVVQTLFMSIPRSISTIFRCSFGDCSTYEGQPLYDRLFVVYGPQVLLASCLFTFFVSIGLFNVISAIFVDATMTATAQSEHAQKLDRLQDNSRFVTRVTRFLDVVLAKQSALPNSEGTVSEGCTTAAIADDTGYELAYGIEVDGDIIDMAVREEAAKQALRELDINEGDFEHLSDILDPQKDKSLNLYEIMVGIKRLRGEPRRSDIVCVDLMVREIHAQIASMEAVVYDIKSLVKDSIKDHPSAARADSFPPSPPSRSV